MSKKYKSSLAGVSWSISVNITEQEYINMHNHIVKLAESKGEKMHHIITKIIKNETQYHCSCGYIGTNTAETLQHIN